jgi:hypothetical protein
MHDTYRSFVNVYGNRFAQFLALLQLSDAAGLSLHGRQGPHGLGAPCC